MTITAEALTTGPDTPVVSRENTPPQGNSTPANETPPQDKPKAPTKRAGGKKTKTIELTLTVTGTADGEWHADLKQGSSYLAKNIAVAAAAVSRAAKELHEDLYTPINQIIESARSQQAAKVAALEAELEAARKALADLD